MQKNPFQSKYVTATSNVIKTTAWKIDIYQKLDIAMTWLGDKMDQIFSSWSAQHTTNQDFAFD